VIRRGRKGASSVVADAGDGVELAAGRVELAADALLSPRMMSRCSLNHTLVSSSIADMWTIMIRHESIISLYSSEALVYTK
jgi:hypothetical protein